MPSSLELTDGRQSLPGSLERLDIVAFAKGGDPQQLEEDRDSLLVSDLLSDLEALGVVRPRCRVFARDVCRKPEQVERPRDQPVVAQLLGKCQTLVGESARPEWIVFEVGNASREVKHPGRG